MNNDKEQTTRVKATKAIISAVGLVATTLSDLLADNLLDFNEAGSLITKVLVAAATVWTVWRVPNKEV